MKMYKHEGHKALSLIAAGFLLGTVGVKALTSRQAKDVYVQGIAAGMRAKNSADELIERAKEQVDDMVAEAEAANRARETQEIIAQ